MSDLSGVLKVNTSEQSPNAPTNEEAAPEAVEAEDTPETQEAAPAEVEAEGEKKAEEPKVEDKKEDPAKSEEDKKFASKFAALSKREKAIAKREKDLQKRIADLEAKAKVAEAPKTEEKEALDLRIKKDPFNTLKELGFDFDALTKIALNEGKLTPEMQLRLQQEQMEAKLNAKIEQLQKEREEERKQQQELQQQAQIDAYKKNIAAHVKANVEKYELLNAENEYGINTVFDVIRAHYNETDEEMSFDEAAEKVENFLLEEAKKRLGLGKLKKLMGEKNASLEETKPATEQKPGEKKQSVTLSNANAQTAGGRKIVAQSREEALEEAAKLIRFSE